MKYLKTIILFASLILVSNLIITMLYYFNIISSSFNSTLKIIIFILSFGLTGINIGKNSTKKGWFEGLKVSLIIMAFFILISLILNYDFNIKQFIYYLISSVTICLGSMFGINFKKKK